MNVYISVFFLLQRLNLIRAHADIYANMHKSNRLSGQCFVIVFINRDTLVSYRVRISDMSALFVALLF